MGRSFSGSNAGGRGVSVPNEVLEVSVGNDGVGAVVSVVPVCNFAAASAARCSAEPIGSAIGFAGCQGNFDVPAAGGAGAGIVCGLGADLDGMSRISASSASRIVSGS